MKPLNHTDEKELLLSLRDGEQLAFAAIFNHYNAFLFLQAYKLTRDEDDARDIVQDIFINLWNSREKLSIHGPLIVYLSKSVRFGFFKMVRSKAYRSRYEEEMATFMAGGHCTTDELLLEQELVAQLKQLAEAMPSKTGRAFILRHLEQYSIDEIAEALDVSPKTVSNMLSQAKNDLKLKLGISILISLLLA